MKSQEVFNFSELLSAEKLMDELPPLKSFKARDGNQLSYRQYIADSHIHFILLHGSAAHSAYLHRLATFLCSRDVNVYAIDLRGHGPEPQRRGDIDYIGQLEDDIADLIDEIKRKTTEEIKIIIGGHSSGGGTALRFGGSKYGSVLNGMILLAPYFGHNAPMVRKNAGGWASPNIPKIIGLSILNGFGFKKWNSAKVLNFNLPTKYQTGLETLSYSFRLMNGMHPADYADCLRKLSAPLLVLVGERDEALDIEKFESGILPHKPDANIKYLDGVAHLDIVSNKHAFAEAIQWISKLFRSNRFSPDET